jgi:hypothetical protein
LIFPGTGVMNVTTAAKRQGENIVFTIDPDNNIAVHAGPPASTENLETFATEKELAKLAADWPGPRLVDTWNSFAGVAPFNDLKPVKKFTSRKLAVARVWAAVQRLAANVAQPARDDAPAKGKAKKSPEKTAGRARAPKGASESRSNKKAEIIALMRRAKGVTLDEIIAATSWQRHTIRGFVSLLGSKGGLKIESTKNAAGERCYRIAK